MFITGKHVSRRTLLRGMGAAIGLPLLDAMTPAFAATSAAPKRFVVTYMPVGTTMKVWPADGVGKDYKLSRIQQPFESLRDHLSIISGLDHHQANALGDGGGDHARAGATFLTGVHCKKTSGADIQAGISADQIVAQKVGKETRFASLELGCEDSRIVGACDSGYSCAYQNSIAWRTPTSPLPPESNPREVFERLFGTQDLSLAPEVRLRRARARKSILDLVLEDTQSLAKGLGPADRRKIDEYLFAVREIERRIETAEVDNKKFTPTIEKPSGVPVTYDEYANLMFDLQILAMQADLTRVMTFMLGREASLRAYPEIGVPEPHHPLTHHRGEPDHIEKVIKINVYHSQLVAGFLQRMKNTPDGEHNLLHNSLALYSSGIADGNRHTHENLPCILAGHGGGAFNKVGRHIVYKNGTPMSNLLLNVMDCMGVPTEKLGDSTGRLEHLTDLA
jgi:hypothetical protein